MPETLIRRWRSTLILVALGLLPFVLFRAETLGQQVFYHHDLQYYFLPYHKLVADITRQGWLPLWNPYAFSGLPLLGDGQTALFYPPNWVFWLIPPALALGVYVVVCLAQPWRRIKPRVVVGCLIALLRVVDSRTPVSV